MVGCRRTARPLRALVAGLAVAIGVPAAAQAPIWHVTLEVEKHAGVDEKTQTRPAPWNPGQSIHENLDLTVEFDVDRERQVVEESLKARYNWSLKEETSFIGQLVARVNGKESGTRLEGPDGTRGLEIFWQRELDPQPCEPKLRVYDDEIMAQIARSGRAGPKPADRLNLEFTAIWPGKVDSEEFINGTKESGKETYPTF